MRTTQKKTQINTDRIKCAPWYIKGNIKTSTKDNDNQHNQRNDKPHHDTGFTN